MELKNYQDYNFADISKEDIIDISELESQLSQKMNKPIVLIAYQPKDDKENNPSFS
jgi:hypothetical protein